MVVSDQVEQSTVQDALHAVTGALATFAPDQHIDAFDISGAQQLLDEQRSNVSGATCQQKTVGRFDRLLSFISAPYVCGLGYLSSGVCPCLQP